MRCKNCGAPLTTRICVYCKVEVSLINPIISKGIFTPNEIRSIEGLPPVDLIPDWNLLGDQIC